MSREAFDAWALRNTSLPSAHEMAWAAWQAALAQPQSKPVAWIYPSALEKFQECETFAHVYSIKVGCPDEESVPLYATPQQAQPIDGFGGNLDAAFDAAPPAPAVPDGWVMVPREPDIAWFRQECVNAGLWPAHDVDGVPAPFIAEARKHHAAMIAAAPGSKP